MLRISVANVLLPTLNNWGWPVRKSRIQLQREVFSPRGLSLLMSFEGTMMLLHLHCLLFGVLGWVSVQHFEISADVGRAI